MKTYEEVEVYSSTILDLSPDLLTPRKRAPIPIGQEAVHKYYTIPFW
jgi:hypothetical protein